MRRRGVDLVRGRRAIRVHAAGRRGRDRPAAARPRRAAGSLRRPSASRRRSRRRGRAARAGCPAASSAASRTWRHAVEHVVGGDGIVHVAEALRVVDRRRPGCRGQRARARTQFDSGMSRLPPMNAPPCTQTSARAGRYGGRHPGRRGSAPGPCGPVTTSSNVVIPSEVREAAFERRRCRCRAAGSAGSPCSASQRMASGTGIRRKSGSRPPASSARRRRPRSRSWSTPSGPATAAGCGPWRVRCAPHRPGSRC